MSKARREHLETAEKIKSASRPITMEDIRELEAKGKRMIEAGRAACWLALRRWREKPVPRRDRVWTGRFDGKRAYRGQEVVLPDGSIGHIFGIQRGWAMVWKPSPFTVEERKRFLLRVEQIKPYHRPSAVALGQCKAGVKERPSLRKRAACRVNGSRPVRPGNRSRGRPRKA